MDHVLNTIRHKYFLFSIRLILGLLLIVSSVGLLPEPVQFVSGITSHGLFSINAATTYTVVLPWIQMALGLCLILGIFTRWVAGAVMLMLASIIAANGTDVYKYGFCG